MALPIRSTPILTGKSARDFNDQFEKNKTKRASKEEIDRIKNTYLKIKLKNNL